MTSNKHVFLSYCRDNKTEVAKLREDLVKAGERVWWDQDIQPGQDWKFEVRKAMKAAYAVVLCLSRESQAREASGIYHEALDAINIYRDCAPGSIFLIPVRLSECDVPSIEIDGTRTLDRLQHQDLFPASEYDTALKKLIGAIQATPLRQMSEEGKNPNIALTAGREQRQNREDVKKQKRSWILVAVIGLVVATTFAGRYLFLKPMPIPVPPKPIDTGQTAAPSKTPSPTLPFYRVQIMMYTSATPPQLRIGKKPVALDGYDGRTATLRLHPGSYQVDAYYLDRICTAVISVTRDMSTEAECHLK
jgi:hypothetical protein